MDQIHYVQWHYNAFYFLFFFFSPPKTTEHYADILSWLSAGWYADPASSRKIRLWFLQASSSLNNSVSLGLKVSRQQVKRFRSATPQDTGITPVPALRIASAAPIQEKWTQTESSTENHYQDEWERQTLSSTRKLNELRFSLANRSLKRFMTDCLKYIKELNTVNVYLS